MRLASLLVALLLGPTFAGCLGGDDPDRRLAQPTSSPIPVPTRASPPREPTTSYNFSDPGYRVTGPWRASDGWDYESNQSHYRRVRVIDARLIAGTTFYYVEEKTGVVGQPAARTTSSWVDGTQWLLLNATDDRGAVDRYQPGVALRDFKNGSFSYERARTESSGRVSVQENVTVQTRLAGTHQTLLFPWGYVEARKVDETASIRAANGARTNATTTRWVHADYRNDVQYEHDGELFKLTAVRAGDFRRGTLA